MENQKVELRYLNFAVKSPELSCCKCHETKMGITVGEDGVAFICENCWNSYIIAWKQLYDIFVTNGDRYKPPISEKVAVKALEMAKKLFGELTEKPSSEKPISPEPVVEADIIDKIMQTQLPLDTKIVKLFAVAMLNYRQPLGDKAWNAMRNLTNPEVTSAISFLAGFSTGGLKVEDLKRLLGDF